MGYMKVCPECKTKSYSASDRGKWKCPECGKDISEVQAKKSDTSEGEI